MLRSVSASTGAVSLATVEIACFGVQHCRRTMCAAHDWADALQYSATDHMQRLAHPPTEKRCDDWNATCARVPAVAPQCALRSDSAPRMARLCRRGLTADWRLSGLVESALPRPGATAAPGLRLLVCILPT
jgi:hypothetical protein